MLRCHSMARALGDLSVLPIGEERAPTSNREHIMMQRIEAKSNSFGPRCGRRSEGPDRGPNLLPCSEGSRAEDGHNFENGTENPQMAAVVPVVLDVPKRPINGQSEPGS